MYKSEFQIFTARSKMLIATEFLLLYGAFFWVARYVLSQAPTQTLDYPPYPWFVYPAVYALMVQPLLLGMGLYNPKFREGFSEVLKRVFVGVVAGSLFFLTALFMVFDQAFPIVQMSAAPVVAALAMTLVRYPVFKFNWIAANKRNVLVLGSGERASIIEKRMRRRIDRQGFNLVGFVPMKGDCQDAINEEKQVALTTEELLDYTLRQGINEIVVACDDRRRILPTDFLFSCKLRGINVIEILDFIERETGQLAINLAYPSWIIYSDGFTVNHSFSELFARTYNTVLALGVFMVTWPLMILTALAIKLEDGWRAPVLYFQERVGLGGKIFRIVKFRSMCVNAETGGAVWSSANDRRITRVGSFIRKYRLDELPQLYNVVRGDMYFVGPRPERPELIKNLSLEIPFYNYRHNVRPGLTGWAQLKYSYGASVEDAVEKLKYDLYYIKHRNFILDISILVLTAEVVVFGKGR